MLVVIQTVVLAAVMIAVVLWASRFPYPSPLIRRWLPLRKRWPETQIRDWLRTGPFHRSFLDYCYRDLERVIPRGDGWIALADGLFTSADVKDGVRHPVITLSSWDMRVQRSPLAGTVLRVESHGEALMNGDGREFAFLREKPCPVQKRLVFDTAAGEIVVRSITGVAARRIEAWVKPGDVVQRGQRIGRILLGSTVVPELPPDLLLRVRIGDRVRAGETVVAAAGNQA